jgi:hypothetical protein
MRERDVQSKVVGYARRLGVIARKLDFGEGWPDYLFLYRGRILFIEFKSTVGRLRPLQGHIHGVLRNSGFVVGVVNESTKGFEIIDRFIASTGNISVYCVDTTKELCK